MSDTAGRDEKSSKPSSRRTLRCWEVEQTILPQLRRFHTQATTEWAREVFWRWYNRERLFLQSKRLSFGVPYPVLQEFLDYPQSRALCPTPQRPWNWTTPGAAAWADLHSSKQQTGRPQTPFTQIPFAQRLTPKPARVTLTDEEFEHLLKFADFTVTTFRGCAVLGFQTLWGAFCDRITGLPCPPHAFKHDGFELHKACASGDFLTAQSLIAATRGSKEDFVNRPFSHPAAKISENDGTGIPRVQSSGCGGRADVDEMDVCFTAGGAISAPAEDPGSDALLASLNPAKAHNRKRLTSTLPLIVAARFERPSIIALLVGAKADVEAAKLDFGTALFVGAQEGSAQSVRALLRAKCEVDTRVSRQISTPLYVAIRNRHYEVVDALLEAKATVERITPTSSRSSYVAPLTAAATSGDLEMCKKLLNAKAQALGGDSWRLRSSFKESPLVAATAHGHISVVQLLLQHISVLNVEPLQGASKLPVHADSTDSINSGGGPRTSAAAAGGGSVSEDLDKEKIADVISHALRVHISSDCSRATHETSEANLAANDTSSLSTSNTVRERPSANIAAENPVAASLINAKAHLQSSLTEAVKHGSTDVALLLVGAKATVACGNSDDGIAARGSANGVVDSAIEPLLPVAARNDNVAMVEALLHAKCPVNVQSAGGATALYIAASKGFTAIVKALLAADADVAICKNNWSPLRSAACNGHLEVVRLLLQSGSYSREPACTRQPSRSQLPPQRRGKPNASSLDGAVAPTSLSCGGGRAAPGLSSPSRAAQPHPDSEMSTADFESSDVGYPLPFSAAAPVSAVVGRGASVDNARTPRSPRHVAHSAASPLVRLHNVVQAACGRRKYDATIAACVWQVLEFCAREHGRVAAAGLAAGIPSHPVHLSHYERANAHQNTTARSGPSLPSADFNSAEQPDAVCRPSANTKDWPELSTLASQVFSNELQFAAAAGNVTAIVRALQHTTGPACGKPLYSRSDVVGALRVASEALLGATDARDAAAKAASSPNRNRYRCFVFLAFVLQICGLAQSIPSLERCHLFGSFSLGWSTCLGLELPALKQKRKWYL
eukprot:INCI11331.1.p1 GENE.INCI11331.1~~INCI11331.1.p1  ORF type:complete len:1070 (+),score=150.39 INCI11331.1:306-3515(+)